MRQLSPQSLLFFLTLSKYLFRYLSDWSPDSTFRSDRPQIIAAAFGLTIQSLTKCPSRSHMKHLRPILGCCWGCLGDLNCCGVCPYCLGCECYEATTFELFLSLRGDNGLGHWRCKCTNLLQLKHSRISDRRPQILEGFELIPNTTSVAWASTQFPVFFPSSWMDFGFFPLSAWPFPLDRCWNTVFKSPMSLAHQMFFFSFC